jgi:ADP-ribose pyrophosphatase
VFEISDHLKENVISSSYLYRGRIINVRQDRVTVPGGQTAFREIVEHPGAVAILAFDGEGKVILVRQHRQPAAEILLEIPAGKLEANEEPLQCARREMLEETGYEGSDWREIFIFYPSPGFCDEKIYLFRAEGLKEAESSTSDPDENLELTAIPLKNAWDMVIRGEIKDGKTIIALQYAMIEAT